MNLFLNKFSIQDLKDTYEDIVTSFNEDVLSKSKDLPIDFAAIKEEDVKFKFQCFFILIEFLFDLSNNKAFGLG